MSNALAPSLRRLRSVALLLVAVSILVSVATKGENKRASRHEINGEPGALGEFQLFRHRVSGNPGLLQGEQQPHQPKEPHYKSSSFNPQPLLIAALCALGAGLRLFWQARSFCWMMLGVLLMGAGWIYILLLI